MKKTYIIATDVYMFADEAKMTDFVGTWRELLEHLLDTASWDVEDGEKTAAEHSDEELVKMFDDANGDGQPYMQVWCVEDKKQVLG